MVALVGAGLAAPAPLRAQSILDAAAREATPDRLTLAVQEAFQQTVAVDGAVAESDATPDVPEPGIDHRGLINQSLVFLAVQHGYRLGWEEKSRAELKGPFFKDWLDSIRIKGWGDGGKVFTNYVAHPMMGAASASIFANNDPVSQQAEFWGDGYWRAKRRQFIFALIYSEQFELGPLSESSLGNIGKRDKMTWVDHVVTPPLGIAWAIGEDAVDHFVLGPLHRRNRYLANAIAILGTPGKSMANLARFKPPWHRDGWSRLHTPDGR
ncbi:MAG: hypothetical protein FJW23_04465 [Acidimicrobiia bacterium]|nr:hypothetical protein [Acidimicrobiia bacterium]